MLFLLCCLLGGGSCVEGLRQVGVREEMFNMGVEVLLR